MRADHLRRTSAAGASRVAQRRDSCSPNTLVNDDRSWSGQVDLGRMGVGDRWADIAIATWSTTWNYGPGWEGELLAAYGFDADPDRTRYFRLLWDLTD